MSTTRLSLHNRTTLRITPGSGATVARLTQALRARSLEPTISWSDRTLYVSADSTPTVLEALREISIEVDPSVIEREKRFAADAESLQRSKAVIKSLSQPGAARRYLSDFSDAVRLDRHQIEAVAVATHPDISGLCLFDEQGLGKTVSALFAFHRLRSMDAVDAMLVLCPKNMVLEWQNDATRFFANSYRTQVVLGSMTEKRRALDECADIYVTNFESAIRLFLRLKQLLASPRRRFLMVVDESFYVKNTDALRSRAVRGLRQCADRCLVLCGTPAPNRPHDLVEQFNIADGGAAFRGVALPKNPADALPHVQRILDTRAIYLRRTKAVELPTLPPKSFQEVLIPLQPVQQRLYADALDGFLADLVAVSDRTFRKEIASFIAKRTRLLQICSNPCSLAADYTETPAKLAALDSLLTELISRRGEKIIVWSFYTASIEAMMHRFAAFKPLRFDGQVTNPHTRRESVRKFQQEDTSMLFIANPAAAGAGLTLHRARFAIYESFSTQAAHYFQSLDRIHRRGQQRAVEYIVLLCDRTIESAEYSRLLRKERMSQTLLGDVTTAPITRSDMLKEAQDAAKTLYDSFS